MNERQCFWTIQREPGEGLRAFIVRTWQQAYPDMTPAQIQAIPPGQSSAEVVKDGYSSPYRFADVLREMVGNPDAGVLGAYRGVRATIYYAWNQGDGDGPTLAAFYNPDLRQNGHGMDAIDFFDAVDALG